MADFEEKIPSGLWGTIIFLFIEILLIVCLVPNAFIDRSILKEQEWGEMLMGKTSHEMLIEDTNSLYITLMLDSCSGQLIPDTVLSFSSALAGASPSLN